MEFREVVRRRLMVRNYAETAVDPATLDRMLDHATRAPSAGFSQGWGFVVLDEPDAVSRFWATASDDGKPPPDRPSGRSRIDPTTEGLGLADLLAGALAEAHVSRGIKRLISLRLELLADGQD